MTVTPTQLYAGTLTTTLSSVLYTVPADTITVVTGITICNTSGGAAALTLALDGTAVFTAAPVPAGETWLIGPDDIRQVLPTGATVTGGAGTAAALDVRITGAEVT